MVKRRQPADQTGAADGSAEAPAEEPRLGRTRQSVIDANHHPVALPAARPRRQPRAAVAPAAAIEEQEPDREEAEEAAVAGISEPEATDTAVPAPKKRRGRAAAAAIQAAAPVQAVAPAASEVPDTEEAEAAAVGTSEPEATVAAVPPPAKQTVKGPSIRTAKANAAAAAAAQAAGAIEEEEEVEEEEQEVGVADVAGSVRGDPAPVPEDEEDPPDPEADRLFSEWLRGGTAGNAAAPAAAPGAAHVVMEGAAVAVDVVEENGVDALLDSLNELDAMDTHGPDGVQSMVAAITQAAVADSADPEGLREVADAALEEELSKGTDEQQQKFKELSTRQRTNEQATHDAPRRTRVALLTCLPRAQAGGTESETGVGEFWHDQRFD